MTLWPLVQSCEELTCFNVQLGLPDVEYKVMIMILQIFFCDSIKGSCGPSTIVHRNITVTIGV